MEVLPFLKGKVWNEVALAYVHSLRPSLIRVIPKNNCQTLDMQLWRVTIHIEDNGTIKDISQEVEVGLPVGIPHGMGLEDALRYGVDSPQVAWHNLSGTVLYVFGKMYKLTDDNNQIEYPR